VDGDRHGGTNGKKIAGLKTRHYIGMTAVAVAVAGASATPTYLSAAP